MEGYAVFEALGEDPGEVDGGVDADGGEGCGGGEAGGVGGGREGADLGGLARCCSGRVYPILGETNVWDDVFEPGGWREQFGEPGCCCGVCVFGAGVNFAFLGSY